MKKSVNQDNFLSIKDIRAIAIVAFFVVAFAFGAAMPFLAHADNDHGSGGHSSGNHENNDSNDNNGHNDGDHNNDGHGDNGHGNDNNGHDGDDNHGGHDNDDHGHDGDNHHGHHGDDEDDNGGDDETPAPQFGGIAVIKNTVGGDGTFSFGGSNTFTITTIEGAGEQDFYNVPVGSYTLSEIVPEGWAMTSNSCSEGFTVSTNATTTCTVLNTKNPVTPPVDDGGGQGGGGGEITPPPPPPPPPAPTGGGGNGPIAGSLGGGGNGPISGSVLGASTSLPELPNGCSALLKSYMRMGKHNDSDEVKKLQEFLNKQLGLSIPVTGFFGKETDAAVRQFQKSSEPQILTPWGIKEATGYVYKTTQRWINLTNCSGLNIPMPELN